MLTGGSTQQINEANGEWNDVFIVLWQHHDRATTLHILHTRKTTSTQHYSLVEDLASMTHEQSEE